MPTRSAPSSRRVASAIPGTFASVMKIAVLPGDGIGREIVAQAVKVLDRLRLPLEMHEAPVGGAGVDAAGEPLPGATLRLAEDADPGPFGAGGRPRFAGLAAPPPP